MIIDDQSPPGAWKNEMAAAPWGYGQSQRQQVHGALVDVRQRGLWAQAEVLEREIRTLQAELESIRNGRR